MPIVADAAVAVRGDLTKFNQDLKGAGKGADTLGQKMNAALSPKNIAAGLGIGFGVAQLTSFIGDATAAAAEFQDSVSATGVIFGEEMIPQMEAWGEAAHSSFGASKQDALAAANVIATLGKAAGLAGQDLVGFSQQMVQLGGDLASMYGGTTTDAINAVSSALRGEFEPIRRYGVILDDATLRQKAFEMGLISTTKNALTPQQKVLASQAAILASTGDAQGDFGRTSEGMANSQRDLAAQLENVNIEIGEKMIPIMLELVNFISKEGIPVLRTFMELLDFGNLKSAKDIPVLGQIEDLLNSTQDASLVLNDMLWLRENDIRAAAEKISVDYMTMRERVRRIMDQFGVDHEEAITRVLAADAALASGKEGWAAYQAMIEARGQGVRDAADGVADGIPDAFADAKEEAEEIVRSTPGALADQLREGIDDYDKAIDELAEVAANSVSDLAERQKIEGILASQTLTDALTSDSTRTRLLAQELVSDLVSDYELLAPGALTAGELVNPALSDGLTANLSLTQDAAAAIVDAAGNPLVELEGLAYDYGFNMGTGYAAGMDAAYGYVRTAAGGLARAARGQIGIDSEPKDHDSPLRGITRWGGNIVRTIADGIYGELGVGSNAAAALAGALVPGMPVSGMTLAGAGVTPSGGITYQLVLNGVPKTFNSEQSMLDALKDLSAFGEGRLS